MQTMIARPATIERAIEANLAESHRNRYIDAVYREKSENYQRRHRALREVRDTGRSCEWVRPPKEVLGVI